MDWYKGRGILLAVAVSLLILLVILATTEAKVGYNLNVDVSGTKWSRSQSTEVLNYKADGECRGTGNSSKYVNIPGFAGIGLKEITYTKYGQLYNKNTYNVTARLNWIYITENIDDTPASNISIISDNGTFINTTRDAKSHYYAEINESMPTLVRNDDETYYNGLGIYSRNSYTSNQDKMCTDYYATSLSKASKFAGVYSNALVTVDVVPGRVDEKVLENSATAFNLQSVSNKYSRLKYKSGSAYSDEEYMGEFKINRKFSRYSSFKLSSEDYWLGCCYPDTEFIRPANWNCECIFDAHSPLSYTTVSK